MKSHPPDSIRLNLLDPAIREVILAWWSALAARNEPVARDDFITTLRDGLVARSVPITLVDTTAIWTFVYPGLSSTNTRGEP